MRITVEPIDLNVHFPPDPAVAQKLDQILAALQTLTNQGVKIMAEIDDLNAAVTAEQTVEASAITLLNGLSAQLTAALNSSTPNAAIQGVITNINANASALAAAVAANTPAAPPATPPASGTP